MRRTYEVENASIHIVAPEGHPVEWVNAAGDWISISAAGTVLGKGQHFRTTDAAKIAEFDHLVSLKYLKLASDEPDYKDPEPVVVAAPEFEPPPDKVEGKTLGTALRTFTMHAAVDAGVEYLSGDMGQWKQVSGSITFHHGVKIRAKIGSIELDELITDGFIRKHDEDPKVDSPLEE